MNCLSRHQVSVQTRRLLWAKLKNVLIWLSTWHNWAFFKACFCIDTSSLCFQKNIFYELPQMWRNLDIEWFALLLGVTFEPGRGEAEGVRTEQSASLCHREQLLKAAMVRTSHLYLCNSITLHSLIKMVCVLLLNQDCDETGGDCMQVWIRL